MMDDKHEQIADVYKEKAFVGKITRTIKGSVFEYDKTYLEHAGADGGIAYNLPCSQQRYETFGVNLHTFFAGLLPEGLRLEALTRSVKTSKDDLLSLLMASGTDCVGDISIVKEGEQLVELAPDIDTPHLGEVSFAELFKESISYETAADGIVDEISLPGIQDKISANLISFPVTTKRKNKEYILKLNPSDKPLLVENEHFFLRMADDCGIETARSEIVFDKKNESGLLVERFDRIFTSNQSHPRKVHQEDACQFLDRYPADKYTQINCRMIAEGIEKFCAAPIVEIAKLLRLIAFSYLIGNGDLHAKNVSIYTSHLTNRTELTPAYDLLSTLPYGDNRMALKFEGRDDNLKRSDFVAFGKRHGVNEGVVISMLNELCEKTMGWSKRVGEIGLSAKKTKHLTSTMQKRCSDLLIRRRSRPG